MKTRIRRGQFEAICKSLFGEKDAWQDADWTVERPNARVNVYKIPTGFEGVTLVIENDNIMKRATYHIVAGRNLFDLLEATGVGLEGGSYGLAGGRA